MTRTVALVVVSTFVFAAAPSGRAAGLNRGGPRCYSDRECDDGRFCNGDERCVGRRQVTGPFGVVFYEEPGRCRAAREAACVSSSDSPTICDEEERTCRPPDCTDADGDNHGSPACGGDDCDDTDPLRFPGRPETCDAAGLDEDCDLETVGERDEDRDGFLDAACCNVVPGSSRCGEDCDDGRRGVHPNASEVCDGRDNDCDGAVDEDVQVTVYVDADGDGFGAFGSAPEQACAPASNRSLRATDCDDAQAGVHPGALVCGVQGSMFLCEGDGTFAPVACGGVCRPQPNGTGVCP